MNLIDACSVTPLSGHCRYYSIMRLFNYSLDRVAAVKLDEVINICHHHSTTRSDYFSQDPAPMYIDL